MSSNALNVALLRESFDLLATRESKITARFYEILFERYPQTRPMFSRKTPEKQQQMLAEALVAVLDHLEDASWLEQNLQAMGATHATYEVTSEMYGWVGECLLATFAEVAGDDWSPELEEAWATAYGALSSLMIQGAEASRAA